MPGNCLTVAARWRQYSHRAGGMYTHMNTCCSQAVVCKMGIFKDAPGLLEDALVVTKEVPAHLRGHFRGPLKSAVDRWFVFGYQGS